MPPLRKTMTNLTSVTVSTARAAFLTLPPPDPAPLSLCFPGCRTPSLSLAGSPSWACPPARMPAAKAPFLVASGQGFAHSGVCA